MSFLIEELEIERLNLDLRKRRRNKENEDFFKKKIFELSKNYSIKEVVVFFSDIEGKLLHLEYDIEFFLESAENLTFDGSSVEGFSSQDQSDLKLKIDWSSLRIIPKEIFGGVKFLFFGLVESLDNRVYHSDFRYRLLELKNEIEKKDNLKFNVAAEIEGFIFKEQNVEQNFNEKDFEFASKGGYFNSNANSELKIFSNELFRIIRILGFEIEKHHPEVAPSQFEINYKYQDVLEACDSIQFYKFIARQIAISMNCTVSFLPKPIANINGSGMHFNISIQKDNKNIFYKKDQIISEEGFNFVDSILKEARALCLILNSSVNSYRRLDPHFEAPNEIKFSKIDRSSMIRIPNANEKSTRIEIRSVAPDTNPYLAMFAIINIGIEKLNKKIELKEDLKIEKLPMNISEGIEEFKNSKRLKEILKEEAFFKYINSKEKVANRSPRLLGRLVKVEEILFHHEVRDQEIWTNF